MKKVYCALVHFPIRSKEGDEIATAVTNLDVHDLARISRTYDLSAYVLVTPVKAQQELVKGIAWHWQEGPGKKRVPARAEAFSRVRVSESVESLMEEIEKKEGKKPLLIATAARFINPEQLLSYSKAKALLAKNEPALILFGTGYGLTDEIIKKADILLPPIKPSDYNHLSVRAAAAITMDRLFGELDNGLNF